MYTIVHGYCMKRRNSLGFCYFDRSLNSLDLTEKKTFLDLAKLVLSILVIGFFYRSNRETNISTTKERNCFILKNITRSKKEKLQWPRVVSTAALLLFYLYLFA